MSSLWGRHRRAHTVSHAQGGASPRGRWLPALAAPYVALLVGAVAGSLPAVLVSVAAALVVDPWVRRTWPDSEERLDAAGMGPVQRFFLRVVLLGLVVAAQPGVTGLLAGSLLLGAGLVAVACGLWTVLERRSRRRLRHRIAWRGLEGVGLPAGPPAITPATFPGATAGAVSVPPVEVFLLAGVVLSLALDSWAPAWGGLVVTLLVAFAFVGEALRVERASAQAPTTADLMPTLVDALTRLAPEVVVYFSSPDSGTYALRVWLDTIRRFTNPVLIVLREAHHLEQLDLAGLPVVVLPQAADVEAAQVPSMRVVLYPTNVVKNNHMIRLPGLRHAFIGHGDSDKAGSFSPVTRVYDEIWVAGEAGRDRYVTAGEGVRPEQVRLVSRPQTAGLVRRPVGAGPVPTVLYAPTWEGFYDESDYCSVASPGLEAVRAMVASGRVRVLFKPHPASGDRREDVLAALAGIEALVAGAPHARVPDGPEALYDAMNEADLLISDVSSVLSDWLACGRPYLVTNPQRLPAEELHSRFPTTRGGAVLAPGQDVLPLVDVAVGADPMAGAREELSRYLLGPHRQDPMQDFVDEVAAFVARTPSPRSDRLEEAR